MEIIRFDSIPTPEEDHRGDASVPFMLKFIEEAKSSPVLIQTEFGDTQCYLGVTSDNIGDYTSD